MLNRAAACRIWQRRTVFSAIVLGALSSSCVAASIKPGDDFFAYANGSWLKTTAIPVGKERWAVRNEIEDITRRRVAQLLADASKAPPGSSARKVADFQAALLNESGIEARGRAPLQPLLDSIDRLQDKASLIRLLAHEMRADVDPLNAGVFRSSSLLGLAVQPSIHGEKTNVAFLVQGGLGLPDREHYLGTEPHTVALRAKYRAYVARMLTLAGCGNADQRADAVVALETAIARTHASREASANDHNADTVWEREHFVLLAPGMDWPVFFSEAGLTSQTVLVPWQPSAVRGVATLIASQPVETWKDYLRVRAFDAYADALPAEVAREASALRDAWTGGEPQPLSRAQRAASTTRLAMSEAIGRMYVERYFPAEQKARVQGIAANVVAAFAKRLESVTWMSPATRAVALEKVKSLYVGIGYPDRWSDYSDLVIDPSDAVGNIRRVERRNYRHALALLDAPVDHTLWWIAPQTVGGVLIFHQNAYEISAALLQPTKFDPIASDAASYGAIGAIIGHDVVHFIDVLGAEYETNGHMRRWWTPQDTQRFTAAVDPLVRQFSAYRPFPDVAINGTLTQTENIADIGGVAAAFDAYRLSLGSKVADKEFVRRSDREFFIAFAQAWRTRISDAAMRAQAASNDHAPEMYRVSTVRNFDAWYDAFDVRPGQRLYLEPSARVRIW